jgi:SprT protein
MKFKPNCQSLLKKSTEIKKGLARFVPQTALDHVCELILANPFHLNITAPRLTKLGDFRVSAKGLHRISVNGDLNPYAFLITLIHEIAHLRTWDEHGRKVMPHGKEWKEEYTRLLDPVLKGEVFPEDVAFVLRQYAAKPTASSCTHLPLQRALQNYDDKVEFTVERVLEGQQFEFRGKHYIKGKKNRTRYRCEQKPSGKIYLFNALTPVIPVENLLENSMS